MVTDNECETLREDQRFSLQDRVESIRRLVVIYQKKTKKSIRQSKLSQPGKKIETLRPSSVKKKIETLRRTQLLKNKTATS